MDTRSSRADVPVDVLGEVLAALEPTARLWFRAELGRPFAVAVPEEPGAIRFHVASAGHCHVAVGDGAPQRLGPGDLAMVPHGAAHVISDAPGRTALPLAEILEACGFDGVGPLRAGGAGAVSVLVCGQFRFEADVQHPFLASLPPLLYSRADAETSFGWIEPLLRHIEREARREPAGHQEVIRRLSEIALVELLRGHVDAARPGALSALADPPLGRALSALHERPEADWSLGALARIAGQSRSVFVERFRERVGVPPMRYLAAWRMRKARGLLALAGVSVGEVARRVGYASESAFHRAFRAEFGISPGDFRRRAGAA